MKYFAFSLLICFSLAVSAQELSGFPNEHSSTDPSINFFELNTPHFPSTEISKINLKMPSLYEQGQFGTEDNWSTPSVDTRVFCPTGGNPINGLIGTQSVFNFQLSKTRVTTIYTFDVMGNLVNSEIIFGGN
ncbi:MAG: hypothetical protein R8G66_24190 [Cytophagales bacterium]|nr:hypothetical protein [Cytophagales bacterium]